MKLDGSMAITFLALEPVFDANAERLRDSLARLAAMPKGRQKDALVWVLAAQVDQWACKRVRGWRSLPAERRATMALYSVIAHSALSTADDREIERMCRSRGREAVSSPKKGAAIYAA